LRNKASDESRCDGEERKRRKGAGGDRKAACEEGKRDLKPRQGGGEKHQADAVRPAKDVPPVFDKSHF